MTYRQPLSSAYRRTRMETAENTTGEHAHTHTHTHTHRHTPCSHKHRYRHREKLRHPVQTASTAHVCVPGGWMMFSSRAPPSCCPPGLINLSRTEARGRR